MMFCVRPILLLSAVCMSVTANAAQAYDFHFTMGTAHACVSPDIASRLHFQSGGGELKGDVKLVLELPEGIVPVGACSRAAARAVVDPALLTGAEQTARDGRPYRRFEIPLPSTWRAQAFVYLDTTLEPGTETVAFYWTLTKGSKSSEHRLPIEIVSVHKVKNRPRRLLIGQGWENRSVFEAWPDFETEYPALGLRFLSITDHDVQKHPIVQDARQFVARCTNAGISVSATVSPGQNMKRIIRDADPAGALARTSEGEIFQNGKNTAFCPSYRGELFDAAILAPLRSIAAHGISMVAFDYELGFGSMDGNGGNNYVCFCERCLQKFKAYLKAEHPSLEYVDPCVFEPLFDKYPEHHEAWRAFMSDQVAGWFRVKKAAFAAACKEHGAASTPDIWFHDYGSPGGWEEAHIHLFFQPKNLENGLDFVGPTYYSPDRPQTARWKTQSMHDGRRDFNYPGRHIWPWMTAGYGRKGNAPPADLRSTLLEAFASGLHGMIFYDGTAIDARDFDTISKTIDMVAPLEDVIIEGTYMTAECDDEEAFAHGPSLEGQMLLVVSDYGDEPKEVKVAIPCTRRSVVTDLATGRELAVISPGQNTVAVSIDRERTVPLHVNPTKEDGGAH